MSKAGLNYLQTFILVNYHLLEQSEKSALEAMVILLDDDRISKDQKIEQLVEVLVYVFAKLSEKIKSEKFVPGFREIDLN